MTEAATSVAAIGAKPKRHVFLAAPMSAFRSDDEYRRHQKIIEATRQRLERDPRVASAYFAGSNILSTKDFSDAGDAFLADFRALIGSDLFVLYYPIPTRSSALVEVGMAIGRRIPTLLACRQRQDLVFLLQSASRHSGQHEIPLIEIWEWDGDLVDIEALTAKILATVGQIADG